VKAEHADAARFLAESAAAMDEMMANMHVDRTGDVDADFAAMMIAHHEGAIAMAVAYLRYGANERLRRIAQEIIVEQQEEIAVMRLALGQPLPPSAPAPTDVPPATGHAGPHPRSLNDGRRERGNVANMQMETGEELMRTRALTSVLAGTILACAVPAWAGQAPFAATAQDVPVSSRDRVYAAEQFSNTVSVTDPASNTLLGVIRLGDPEPGNLSPLYKGQLLVHGMGFSPDLKTLAVVSIGSNSVTFIDTATNTVKHTTYVGRSPHEAFFTPDGKEVWVTVRGEDYVAVLDGTTYEETTRIKVPNGPGMQIFSPDGKYGYVCSSFTPETVITSVADHQIVGRVKQESPFCPNIAATPDGQQVWFTLKDVGKTQVINAQPPFEVLKTIDTGPITNHVNFAHNANGTFAYVTVGGWNEVKVFRIDTFEQVATIPVGNLPHGVWPSGDGSRIYAGLENADALAAIDTLTNEVIATIPIGQAPQAVNYVPNAVPDGDGTANLQPLGVAGQATHLRLVSANGHKDGGTAPTSVALFDQGLTQIVQASITGLEPKKPYVLALARRPDGGGRLEPLSAFMTNPAGSAIVNAVGPIRQIVQNQDTGARRYLVIAEGTATQPGMIVQRQAVN
jgi:YVTN family beta-propeller protein